tara:strand:+ start:28 stop:294 length:267 start_codon:yes stop_codon:yes gene_type:complete
MGSAGGARGSGLDAMSAVVILEQFFDRPEDSAPPFVVATQPVRRPQIGVAPLPNAVPYSEVRRRMMEEEEKKKRHVPAKGKSKKKKRR